MKVRYFISYVVGYQGLVTRENPTGEVTFYGNTTVDCPAIRDFGPLLQMQRDLAKLHNAPEGSVIVLSVCPLATLEAATGNDAKNNQN